MRERNPHSALLAGGAALLGAIAGAGIAKYLRPPAEAPPDEKLEYLLDLAEAQTVLLERLVNIGEQLIGKVPIVIEPEVKALPRLLTPGEIVGIYEVDGLEGMIRVGSKDVLFILPKRGRRLLRCRLPAGWCVIFARPIIITASFYSRELRLSWVTLNPGKGVEFERWVVLPRFPRHITAPTEVALGPWGTIEIGSDWFFVNDTDRDILVRMEVPHWVMLHEDIAVDEYKPLLRLMRGIIREWARADLGA